MTKVHFVPKIRNDGKVFVDGVPLRHMGKVLRSGDLEVGDTILFDRKSGVVTEIIKEKKREPVQQNS